MNLKWILLGALFFLVFSYEYAKHVLIEGHEFSEILPSLLYYIAIIVPLVLLTFSKIEKQAKELADREKKLRSFIESTRDAVYEVNQEGYFTFMNQAGAEMCALATPEEVVGRHATEFWAKPSERKAYLSELKEKGYVVKYSMLARRANGELAYWELTSTALRDEEGNFVAIRGICRDVTERRKLEEQLREYAEKLEEKVEERTKKLAMLNDMVGRISRKLDYQEVLELTAEKAAELVDAETVAIPIVSEDYSVISYPAVYGRHAAKILGRSKPLRKRSICGWVIRNKKPFYSDNISRDRRELNEVKKLLNLRAAISAPLLYKDKVLGGITALNKADDGAFTREDLQHLSLLAGNAAIALRNAMLMEEIKGYASRLKRSNELKDLFTDIMRHDLLTPAGIISNYAELLLDDLKDAGARNSVETIERNVEKLIVLIEGASKLARLESEKELKLQQKDLGAVMQEVILNFEPLIREKELRVEYEQEEAPALVSPMMEEVFSNLLSNAIKYSPEKSNIIVGIEDEGSNWKIMFRDQGEGISDKFKKDIFDRFKRMGKSGVKGTGLGLAIVKRVVELHKGKVWVEDNPGGGSIFYVSIPKRRNLNE